MRRFIFFFLLFILISSAAFSQNPRADMWINHMELFAAEDQERGDKPASVLFVGSSSFMLWKTVQEDFPGSDILNRAFGGSMMSDVIYYFDQVIKPYAPRQIVIYQGDNDLAGSGKSPANFFEEVVTICRMVQIHFPDAKIVLVSIKPSPSRERFFSEYMAANHLMKLYADQNAHIEFVDIWEPMLTTDGKANSALFEHDRLHMNRLGYEIWIEKIKPFLLLKDD